MSIQDATSTNASSRYTAPPNRPDWAVSVEVIREDADAHVWQFVGPRHDSAGVSAQLVQLVSYEIAGESYEHNGIEVRVVSDSQADQTNTVDEHFTLANAVTLIDLLAAASVDVGFARRADVETLALAVESTDHGADGVRERFDFSTPTARIEVARWDGGNWYLSVDSDAMSGSTVADAADNARAVSKASEALLRLLGETDTREVA